MQKIKTKAIQRKMTKKKLLLIGWDAADWKIIGPLLAKGQMPALKKVIDNGVYGNMSTMNPPYSPMLWSSVATGKTPDKHGVLGFIELLPDLKGVRPVTANSRKSRAIWNILHNKGYKSNLVGWWPSFPAEPINGVVISDKFQKVSNDPTKKSILPDEAIHPKDMIDQFRDLRMFPHEITKEHILPFIPRAAEIDQEKNALLKAFSRIMAHNVSVHNAATRLLRTTEWDFMAVYYDLIDHFCHGFMKYHPPKMDVVSQDDYEIFNQTVIGAYRFQDMMLERKLDLIDDDTTVLIMSDHGYESGSRRIIEMPNVQAAPALEHRQFGMFAAMGPGIKKNTKIFGLNLIDIAPTVLHFFDLPIGKDMDGKPIFEMFKKAGKPQYIDSWEEMPGDFGELTQSDLPSEFSDQETMEQLIELGYIDRPDEKKETAILKTKCDLKHNLARVHMGKKDFDKAREILLELIEEKDTIDTAPYYYDLLKIELKFKRFDEAENYLKKIRNSNTKVKFNLFFQETAILQGKGQYEKALQHYENALTKINNPEIWFNAGELKYKLNRFEEARTAFENAIELEPDRAKYNMALAEVLVELGEFEEAVEYAITSIELVKHYPAAHFVLGRALEKLGDLKNAQIAFETAEKLQPKNFQRSRIAREKIEEMLLLPVDEIGNKKYKYRKGQITIVSGLPRSGTSLMMQMLHKGGCNMLIDNKREADTSNPKGYFEYEPVMSIHKSNLWLKEAKDKAVKIVAPLLKFLSPKYRYKIIFMTRDLNEVIKSQQVMQGKDADAFPIKLVESYHKLLNSVEIWKNREAGVEMIYINYKDVLDNPEEIVNKVQEFIGQPMDIDAMMSCVDKSLYRNKVVKKEEV